MKSGVLVIDKPEGMTSHGVVALVRRLAGIKKVGHGGTLDPMATGVLPIFVGNATRVIEFMHEKGDPSAKKYRAEMRLGIVTDTQDTTGEITAQMSPEYSAPELSAVEAALKSFEGESEQIPPAYSAIKYKGKKLYDYAREGKSLPTEAMAKRKIFVENITLTDYRPESLTACFEITGAGGLYVRTICHDAGNILGCGAAMSALRRLKSGPFTIAESVTPEDLERQREDGGADALPLLPTDSALLGLPQLVLPPESAERFMNGITVNDGAPVSVKPEHPQTGEALIGAETTDGRAGIVAVYNGTTASENFIGIGGYESGLLKPRKVIIQ